jgi:hypothetical protein
MALKDFENRSRLLSDDEKELIGVLTSFYERLDTLTKEQQELSNRVTALEAIIGPFLVKQKNDA